ncbi:MAG TPA: GNAT family N-acetyltransferase [Mycobacteriales bacterium]|nr:GNAT family N-acetyltransferase [Mycobacteriales bacterium]
MIRRANVHEIFPLRHAVLRPGRPVTYSVYSEDDGAVHVGAWDDDMLVGCATVFPQPWPGNDALAATPDAWRLRGMAVDPSMQGTGVGRLVLAEGVAAAREAGASVLWANARTAALGFYQRLGWRIIGEEFIATDSGLPHFPMALLLSATNAPLSSH